MRSRALGLGACRVDELVEGALGVEHHHREAAAHRQARALGSARGRPPASSVVIRARPRLLARRLAGSMVRHSTRWPRRAAARPSAAAMVVLPTPPGRRRR